MVILLSPTGGVSLRENREKQGENARFCFFGGAHTEIGRGVRIGRNRAIGGQSLSASVAVTPYPVLVQRADRRAGLPAPRWLRTATPSTMEYGENRQSVYIDSSVRPAIAAQELCPTRFTLPTVVCCRRLLLMASGEGLCSAPLSCGRGAGGEGLSPAPFTFLPFTLSPFLSGSPLPALR